MTYHHILFLCKHIHVEAHNQTRKRVTEAASVNHT